MNVQFKKGVLELIVLVAVKTTKICTDMSWWLRSLRW